MAIEIKPYKDNLDRLKAGTLLRSVEKENNEPENIAIGQVSKELRFLQRQSQYVGEIERVLKELRLTCLLIKDCKTGEVPEGVSRQELLAYHQGNFLTLVHQMKDKIMQLIYLITEDEIPDEPTRENDISVSDLLRKKGDKLKALGIEEAVKKWEQENKDSGIAVALRKRTHHHHRVSGLRYDRDYLNLGFTDIALDPSFQAGLSDYGKTQIEKMREESMGRLFSSALTKANDTLHAIEENIEVIAKALVEHFKLPTSQEAVSEIMTGQSEMLGSLEIKNRCSIDKVGEPHKSILDDLVHEIEERYRDKLSAIYLVGSLPRGEYEEGYSDINVYIVLNVGEEDEAVQALREDSFLSVRVLTQKFFLSEEGARYRIIAKADGVLLSGTDLLKDEKLPKAGLFLAQILFGDIIEILDATQKWIQENPKATQSQIIRKSKRLAKRMIDFIYGVAMSNKPHYTASRKERVEKIHQEFPDKGVINLLMGVSRGGVGDLENLNNMVEGFRPKAELNLKKIQAVKDAIDAQKK